MHYGHSMLENPIQALSKTMSVFKDFSGIENLEKNSRTFKDPQEHGDTNITSKCRVTG